MAIPTAVGSGAVVANVTGSSSPAWGAHLPFDIGLCIIETAREDAAFSDPQGFARVAGFPFGTGTVGASNATQLDVWWARATSNAMPAPTIVDPGDHIICRIVNFRGCVETGVPWDATPTGDTTAATTVVAVPGGTTSLIDCLVLALVAWNLDSGIERIVAGSWANPDLAAPAVLNSLTFAAQTPNGNGGGWSCAIGGKAAAGAYQATTASVVGGTALVQGRASIALKAFVDPGAGGTILPGRNYG